MNLKVVFCKQQWQSLKLVLDTKIDANETMKPIIAKKKCSLIFEMKWNVPILALVQRVMEAENGSLVPYSRGHSFPHTCMYKDIKVNS